MIYGIGTDIVETARVIESCKRESFLLKAFTDDERRQAFSRKKRLAGDFAVKEAVAKAFGTGFGTVALKDIEVLRDDRGRPYVKLYGGAEVFMKEHGIVKMHVSISDTESLVTAFAVAETEGQGI